MNQQEQTTSQWQTQLDDVIKKILNREKFSYDLNGDALYQQYKDKHTRQAEMAMEDSIGMASAMTGGYGNSYAQSVGQQMYQKEMQNLNDIVPELYQMAYDKYNKEGQDLYNQYALLKDRETVEYGKDRDKVADEQWKAALDYQKDRDQVSDEQWKKAFDAQYGNNGAAVYTGIPDNIKEKAASFENNEELAKWAFSLEDSGVIQEGQANQLISEYFDYNEGRKVIGEDGNESYEQLPYGEMIAKQNAWAMVTDGGMNGWGGIDNDAQVKAPNGKTFYMDELYNYLVDEGMDKKDAKTAVKKLQDALEI